MLLMVIEGQIGEVRRGERDGQQWFRADIQFMGGSCSVPLVGEQYGKFVENKGRTVAVKCEMEYRATAGKNQYVNDSFVPKRVVEVQAVGSGKSVDRERT